jgi:hypothetical protein
MIRVGFANIVIFLLILSVLLLSEILDYFSIAKFWKIFVIVIYCIFGIKFYSQSVSSIQKTQKEELIIINTFSRSKIDLADIEWTKIYTIPTSCAIFLLIKRKGALFPNLNHFISPQTNQGSFKETYIKLSSLIEKDKEEN